MSLPRLPGKQPYGAEARKAVLNTRALDQVRGTEPPSILLQGTLATFFANSQQAIRGFHVAPISIARRFYLEHRMSNRT
ncbi:hypothetical protein [Beijerinckia indica]|uniref:hypothetical protein n=1 Tax=Beijerinckia indica TaxID=533 RepID=UPI0005A0301F|nr:hypothetical protein [Beijerinckia indica]